MRRPRRIPRSPSATFASKDCSESPKARYSIICRSTSAITSIGSASARRCARCTPPASSATWSCAATATRCWWSWSSVRRSPSSRSRATRTSRPRICRRACATSASPKARPSTGRCSMRSSSTSPISISAAANTRCASIPRSRICPATRSTWWSTSRRASAPRSSRSTWSATPSSRKRTCSQTFELKTPNWLSWYKQDDRYSRESLHRRSGEAALVLHGSRLRELPDRIDAGRRSRPKKTTCTSPSTSTRATFSGCRTSSSPARWWFRRRSCASSC